MVLSVRERILVAALARLATIPNVKVFRNRRREISASELPALILYDGDQSAPDEAFNQTAEYTLSVEIEGYVTVKTDAEIGPAVNDLYAKALQAMLADRTLGGLVTDVTDGPMNMQTARTEGSAPIAGFALAFDVKFATVPGDPFTPAP